LDYSKEEIATADRPFPARYAVLGLLIEQPCHGYELSSRLEAALGPVWQVARSRLYLALRRMEEQGMVSVRTQVQRNRPDRRTYSVTAAGVEAFWRWATTPVRHVRDARVELLAKLFFLHRLDAARLGPFIEGQLAFLDRLRERFAAKERLPMDDPILARLALRFRIGQVESLIAFLRTAEAELLDTRERRTR